MEKAHQSSSNGGLRVWAIIATLLMLVTAGFAWKYWKNSSRLASDVELSEKQLDSLAHVKADLDRQLDSLNVSYVNLRTENETLQGAVARSENIVAQKAAQINQLRQQSTRDVAALRAQIAGMQQAKSEMETIVSLLRSENEQLKAENARLTGENTQLLGDKEKLSGQVVDLSKQLEEQIKRTQSARFKASAFRVEVEKRGDKLTTKAKKVRDINISFDLADVPEAYHGNTKLYLVITDEKATSIACATPVNVTIQAPAGPVNIVSQQQKTIELQSTQRIAFNYKLDEKLKKGNYVAAIYCDKGLLGASSFKLI